MTEEKIKSKFKFKKGDRVELCESDIKWNGDAEFGATGTVMSSYLYEEDGYDVKVIDIDWDEDCDLVNDQYFSHLNETFFKLVGSLGAVQQKDGSNHGFSTCQFGCGCPTEKKPLLFSFTDICPRCGR